MIDDCCLLANAKSILMLIQQVNSRATCIRVGFSAGRTLWESSNYTSAHTHGYLQAITLWAWHCFTQCRLNFIFHVSEAADTSSRLYTLTLFVLLWRLVKRSLSVLLSKSSIFCYFVFPPWKAVLSTKKKTHRSKYSEYTQRTTSGGQPFVDATWDDVLSICGRCEASVQPAAKTPQCLSQSSANTV